VSADVVVSVNVSGVTSGVSVAMVVQLVRFEEVCSVKVAPTVLVMSRVTMPLAARWMGPKLGAGGIRDGLLMVLASKVTEPVRASALPANIVSVCSVMEA